MGCGKGASLSREYQYILQGSKAAGEQTWDEDATSEGERKQKREYLSTLQQQADIKEDAGSFNRGERQCKNKFIGIPKVLLGCRQTWADDGDNQNNNGPRQRWTWVTVCLLRICWSYKSFEEEELIIIATGTGATSLRREDCV